MSIKYCNYPQFNSLMTCSTHFFFKDTKDDQGFWLGGTDFSNEGRWQWISSNNFTDITYSIWGATQPNNRDGAEHCMAAVNYFNYSWSDERCDYGNILQYVCEMRYVAYLIPK